VVGRPGFRKCCKHGSHCVKIFALHLVRIESCFHLAHLDHSTLFIKPVPYGGCKMLSEWLLDVWKDRSACIFTGQAGMLSINTFETSIRFSF
jgi:hypothetical protein